MPATPTSCPRDLELTNDLIGFPCWSQNPPAIPTLPIVKVCASIRNSKVIIDWHNTGWSVLALRLGERSPVVRLAKW